MKRTNLVLDERLLQEAVRLSGERAYSGTVERALDDGARAGAGVFLVDTSVWIEVFRRPARLRLEDLVALDEIVVCLPVVQEVLQGFRDEGAFATAREAMLAMPIVESPLRGGGCVGE